jgi:trk system potassium uptake protein TrkA
MRIVIVGAGRMGYALAQRFDLEGHEVFMLDPNAARVEAANRRLDVMAAVGSGASLGTLRGLGVEGADLLIAASGSDEVNIIACLLAHHLNIARRLARVDNAELAGDLSEIEETVLGVNEFVNPTAITTERLRHIVLTPATIESAEFFDGAVVLRALRVQPGAELCSAPLQQLQAIFADEFRVAAVRRHGELIIPRGTFQIEAGDIVYVVMRAESLERFLEVFEFRRQKTRRVIIFGGGAIGRDLAAALEEEVTDLLLVEPDEKRCAALGETLRRAHIIQGSGLDQALLDDLGVAGADYYLGLSDNDADNLSSALLARQQGAASSLMLTENPDAVGHFEALPLDAVVCPLLLSVGAIWRRVRGKGVVRLVNLATDRGEAVELEVQPAAPVAERPLREVAFPEGAMVAAVRQSGGLQIAAGGTVMRPGDHAVVIALKSAVPSVLDCFVGSA